MAELQATDQFLVNRDDQTQTVEQQALMATLEPTDFLVVNRADVTYKITGEDLIDSIIDDLVISKPVLSTNNPEVGQPITVVASASGGKGPYTYTFQWLKTGDIEITGATAATYTPVNADEGETLACRVTATDVQPESATGTSDYTNAVIKPASPPIIGSIALSEDSPGGDRFTGKSFTTSIAMVDDGIPNSDKLLKAEVEGALTIAGATDEIVGVADLDIFNGASTWDWGTNGQSYDSGMLNPDPAKFSQFRSSQNNGVDGRKWTLNAGTITVTSTLKIALTVQDGGGGEAHPLLINGIDTGYAIPFSSNAAVLTEIPLTNFTLPLTISEMRSVTAGTEDAVFLYQIEVDGVLLTNVSGQSATLLTLASDANLANGAFKPGDLVKQDNSTLR